MARALIVLAAVLAASAAAMAQSMSDIELEELKTNIGQLQVRYLSEMLVRKEREARAAAEERDYWRAWAGYEPVQAAAGASAKRNP